MAAANNNIPLLQKELETITQVILIGRGIPLYWICEVYLAKSLASYKPRNIVVIPEPENGHRSAK